MPGLVLVIDDEPLVRWSLGERLRQAGYEVREAGSGLQARTLFEGVADRAVVVLLDLRLPDVEGLSLFDELRRVHPASQVIILSAHASPELAQRALSSGALHVGSKPFDLEEVVALVRRGFALARP
jgi:DNA-binding NtrC family response regulator